MSMIVHAGRLDPRRTPRFQIALRTGRLIELRVMDSFRTASDIRELSDAIWTELDKSKRRVVICSDYRAVPMVLSPERAEEWGAMMSATSHRVERSAILLDPHKPTFNLQLRRVVAEAGHHDRRFFFEDVAAKAFVSSVLDDEERDRVNRFFSAEHFSSTSVIA